MRRRRRAMLLIPAALLGVAGLEPLGRSPAAIAASPPGGTKAAVPLLRERNDHVARAAAARTVEVRPRIAGEVTDIHFHDGDVVRRGQLLFTLDPKPFAAAFARSRANVASATSALTLARTDLERAMRRGGEASAGEIDASRGRVQAAEAALAIANARARTHSLNLAATQVRAPISGRVSASRVAAGNRVAIGDTVLTTIEAA